MSNNIAIEAIRKQIQVIAFDANLYDLGIITDNPHQLACSRKRKKLNAEIVRLGGTIKPLPFQSGVVKVSKKESSGNQMSMFEVEVS